MSYLRSCSVFGKRSVSFNARWMAPRLYSSVQSASETPAVTEPQMNGKLAFLVKMLPGDSMLKKTTFATVGGSAFAVAVANELYIINYETLYATAFLLTIRAIQCIVGDQIAEFADKGIASIHEGARKFFKRERSVFEDSLATFAEQRQFKQYIHDYLTVAKENIQLESKLNEIQQMNKQATQLKALLDERVRLVTEERENERKKVLTDLIARVMADLKDPKTQDAIMKQCLVDIESLGVRKLAL